MTRDTLEGPSDPSNGPVSNGTAVEEVTIDMHNDRNSLLPQRLYEIKEDRQLSWVLEEWEKQFKASWDLRLQTEARLQDAKNEVYQWIGFYKVFQGAVLTAVTPSTILSCRQSWGPTSLSLIASIITIVTVHFKLVEYGKVKTDLERRRLEAKKLHAQLAELKLQGKNFNFSWFLKRSKHSSGESGKKTVGLKDRYYWAAIGALLLFSSVVVLFCNIILCGSTKYHPGS
ncbi:hypothetical protein CY35_16G088700 [Sphagnum magellanicum]|nr:hypothetical protein CY35_16G088700 [Sphagnum magellanicum]